MLLIVFAQEAHHIVLTLPILDVEQKIVCELHAVLVGHKQLPVNGLLREILIVLRLLNSSTKTLLRSAVEDGLATVDVNGNTTHAVSVRRKHRLETRPVGVIKCFGIDFAPVGGVHGLNTLKTTQAVVVLNHRWQLIVCRREVFHLAHPMTVLLDALHVSAMLPDRLPHAFKRLRLRARLLLRFRLCRRLHRRLLRLVAAVEENHAPLATHKAILFRLAVLAVMDFHGVAVFIEETV